MKRVLARAVLAACAGAATAGAGHAAGQKVVPPPPGVLYHGVYPGGVTGEEDDLTLADVQAYEAAVGQKVAWVYFSHNWYAARAFPQATAAWIRDHGSVPYIRLMLRSSADQALAKKEKEFLLRRIIKGKHDADLRAWADAARDFGSPLLVEYGTECNGCWFPWNGRWNGRARRGYGDHGETDGAERFRDAWRHIVTLMREEGADNITWVFHVNWSDGPEKQWNRLERYYPGDDVVDWVAISAYGPQTPMEKWVDAFVDETDSAYARVQSVAAGKPVIVAEFGCSAGNPKVAPEEWAAPALDALFAARWPAVIGFSWWNERWQNDNHPQHDTTMRMQDIPGLAALFLQELLQHAAQVQVDPLYGS